MKYISYSRPLLPKIIFILFIGILSLVMVLTNLQDGFPFKALIFLSITLLFITFSFDTIFYFLVCFLIFNMNINVSFGRFVIQPIFFIVAFLFLKTVFDSFLEDQKIFSCNSMNYFLIFMMVAFVISSVKCYYILGVETLTKSLVFQIKFLLIALLFYVIVYFSRKENDVYHVLKVLTGMFFLLSFSGVLEYVGIKLGIDYIIRPIFELFGRTEIYSGFGEKSKVLRISGLVGTPENFGFILSFLLPSVVGLIFYSRRYRWVVYIAITLSIISISLSGTRSALLSLGIYVIILLLLGPGYKIKAKLILLFLVTLLLVYPLSKSMRYRFQALLTPDSHQLVMRKQLHRAAYDLSIKEKWFGIGWGTFDDNYQRNLTKYPALYESRQHYREGTNWVHNTYLQFLHDLGIFGLAVFLIFWSSCIVASLKVSLQSENIIFKYLGIGFLSNLISWTILGYFTTGFFLIIGWNTTLPVFFWIYYGLISCILRYDLTNNPL